eukprot:scaffold40377_cov168-Amphora_coffeaeformis.AAC.3
MLSISHFFVLFFLCDSLQPHSVPAFSAVLVGLRNVSCMNYCIISSRHHAHANNNKQTLYINDVIVPKLSGMTATLSLPKTASSAITIRRTPQKPTNPPRRNTLWHPYPKRKYQTCLWQRMENS